ncbi:hypothetical protein Sjap_005540 [Stephania japonica]|uniref:Retrotransposon Copia-like N-terminal domain-containing protein n=1 Tax=Stephania japonica TaxID=461633 RepID=A0AAP0K6L6_9MAGN
MANPAVTVMDSPLQSTEATSSQSSSSVRVLSPFSHSLGQSMSIKLDANNYILWKSLLLPLVTDNNLDEILLGTVPYLDPMDPSTGAPNL